MSRRAAGGAGLAALALAAAAAAQEPPPAAVPPPQRPPLHFELEHAHSHVETLRGDFSEALLYGGFRARWLPLDLEIRGQNALLWYDREAVRSALQTTTAPGGPPRRGIDLPDPRRRLTADLLRERVASLMRALGRPPLPDSPAGFTADDVPRFLYFEGGVLVFRDGIEVVRCEQLWISPLDDRIVVQDAELRYRTAGPGGEQLVIVRGPRLVKQGPRWTGRDLQITTCDAGEPHFAVVSGELEIVEREGQFEVWSRGNRLRVGGVDLLPLPNAHWFTGEQTEIPLKGLAAGYSEREGMRAGVELGLPWNDTGGALHEWLTGRPAHEFRGDWRLGLGWIESRGFPLAGEASYRGGDLYEGRTDAFYLDDDGPDLREIVTSIDGTPIDERNRHLLRTENRVFLGETTHLDLTAFHAGDPAVYSEFFRGDYRSREVPESSVYLHHRSDNVLLTLNGRFNLDDFSYRDNRALAPFFVEELPVATLQWLSEPIAITPWDTPIVLDATTEVGQRRRDFDPLSPGPHPGDRTLRFDQLVELSAPFLLGPLNVRPFVETRFTWYDADVSGEAADRVALAAGVRLGTRLSRTWHWLDDDGEPRALRHVVAPLLTYAERFHVSEPPSQFRQFDEIDALTERSLVRLEVRNLLQHAAGGPDAVPAAEPGQEPRDPRWLDAGAGPRDFLFLDLAQDFWPDAERDNAGETLGLFYYDFLVRPGSALIPLPNVAIGVYGDHDWERGLRTFDAELAFGRVLGLDWMLEYRRDEVVEGALGAGVRTWLLDRWSVDAQATYDYEREDWLQYGLGFRRQDHDWSWFVGLSYDPFDDQVTFRIAFDPTFGGLRAPRDRGWPGDRYGDDRSAASY